MEEKLVELLTKLETLAPEILRIAKRQVLVDAIGDVLMLIGVGIVTVVAVTQTIRVLRTTTEANKYDREPLVLIGVLVSGLCILLLIIGIQPVATLVFNPEWAAIKLLLGQVQ